MQSNLKVRSLNVQKPDIIKGIPEVKLSVEVVHNDGKKTLRLPVNFEKSGMQWSAVIDLSSLPKCNSLDETRLLLSDWLGRAAETLKDNPLESVDLNSVSWD